MTEATSASAHTADESLSNHENLGPNRENVAPNRENVGNLTRLEATARSSALRVHSYLVQLNVGAAADRSVNHFETRSTVSFDAQTEATFLDFLDGEVDGLRVNGSEQPVRYDGARLQLSGLSTSSTNIVEVSARGTYSTSGQGLHRFTDPADGNTYLYTHYEPADSRRVYAQFDQPDLKARHTFEVIAPADWLVWSNQVEVAAEPAGEGLRRHRFAATGRLSTYISAIMAGPYHQVRDSYTTASGHTIELGLACRAARAAQLDHETLFDLTKRGLAFFNEAFGLEYPWGKYDQIFVPEYNLGAMENPGCVTFTEQYLFRERATRAQYAARCNTLLHEMSHMWFGDLVTPQWWDDLWLKESFAEFMGAHASIEIGAFAEAWVGFAGRRKAWAYAQDELPTTHAIVADIADVEAAKQNFDGITYAKGAAVLKQLVHYVGPDAFFAGSRSYFAHHAWGATTLADLLIELEQASGRDLSAWARAWLQTAGPDELAAELTLTEGEGDSTDATIGELRIVQHSRDALTGEDVGRHHLIGVGLYDLIDQRLVRRDLHQVELTGSGATVAEVVHQPAPAMVLVNDADYTYAKVRLDPTSLTTALAAVGTLTDPLARALVWSQLWSMTRDGDLAVRDYVGAVVRHAASEQDAATLTALFGQAQSAIDCFEAPDRLADARRGWVQGLARLLSDPALSDDQRLLTLRAFTAAAARVPESGPSLRNLLLDPERVAAGLEVGQDLRWQLLTSLAAIGQAEVAELDTELARDDSMDGHTHRREALAAMAAGPHTLIAEVLTPGSLSNDHLDAVLAGLRTPLRAPATDVAVSQHPAGDYFTQLTTIWAGHAIEIALRLVRGLFPSHDPAAAAHHGRAWLIAHPEAPAALRRVVLEFVDFAERQVRVQAANH